MNFKKWVKSIQTAGYNGARTVGIHTCTKAFEEAESGHLFEFYVYAQL